MGHPGKINPENSYFITGHVQEMGVCVGKERIVLIFLINHKVNSSDSSATQRNRLEQS